MVIVIILQCTLLVPLEKLVPSCGFGRYLSNQYFRRTEIQSHVCTNCSTLLVLVKKLTALGKIEAKLESKLSAYRFLYQTSVWLKTFICQYWRKNIFTYKIKDVFASKLKIPYSLFGPDIGICVAQNQRKSRPYHRGKKYLH